MPLFSILIVLFRGGFTLIEKNLRNLDFDDYEVIIVDNSEDNDYFNKLKEWKMAFPPEIQKKIFLHQAPFNGGYSGGNNLAFKYSSGEFLLILNPDMELGFNFLSKAKSIIERKPWKIIFPKIYYNFASKILQSTIIIFRKDTILGAFKLLGINQEDKGQFDAYYESYYVHGGCFIISRELFKKLRGFDENYFMYVEETDLCFRAKQLNEKSVFCPQLTAAHRHRGDSPFAKRQMLQNNLIFFGKYFSFLFLMIQFLFSFVRLILQSYEKKKDKLYFERNFSLLKSTCYGFVKGWKNHLLKGY